MQHKIYLISFPYKSICSIHTKYFPGSYSVYTAKQSKLNFLTYGYFLDHLHIFRFLSINWLFSQLFTWIQLFVCKMIIFSTIYMNLVFYFLSCHLLNHLQGFRFSSFKLSFSQPFLHLVSFSPLKQLFSQRFTWISPFVYLVVIFSAIYMDFAFRLLSCYFFNHLYGFSFSPVKGLFSRHLHGFRFLPIRLSFSQPFTWIQLFLSKNF